MKPAIQFQQVLSPNLFFRLQLVFCLLATASACECVKNIPATDFTKPTGDILIKYTNAQGKEINYEVSTKKNEPLTVTIPLNSDFYFFYSFKDPSGIVQSIDLVAVTTFSSDGLAHTSTPLMMPTTYRCPLENILYARGYQKSTERTFFEFTAYATDSKGNSATTPSLVVKHE